MKRWSLLFLFIPLIALFGLASYALAQSWQQNTAWYQVIDEDGHFYDGFWQTYTYDSELGAPIKPDEIPNYQGQSHGPDIADGFGSWRLPYPLTTGWPVSYELGSPEIEFSPPVNQVEYRFYARFEGIDLWADPNTSYCLSVDTEYDWYDPVAQTSGTAANWFLVFILPPNTEWKSIYVVPSVPSGYLVTAARYKFVRNAFHCSRNGYDFLTDDLPPDLEETQPNFRAEDNLLLDNLLIRGLPPAATVTPTPTDTATPTITPTPMTTCFDKEYTFESGTDGFSSYLPGRTISAEGGELRFWPDGNDISGWYTWRGAARDSSVSIQPGASYQYDITYRESPGGWSYGWVDIGYNCGSDDYHSIALVNNGNPGTYSAYMAFPTDICPSAVLALTADEGGPPSTYYSAIDYFRLQMVSDCGTVTPTPTIELCRIDATPGPGTPTWTPTPTVGAGTPTITPLPTCVICQGPTPGPDTPTWTPTPTVGAGTPTPTNIPTCGPTSTATATPAATRTPTGTPTPPTYTPAPGSPTPTPGGPTNTPGPTWTPKPTWTPGPTWTPAATWTPPPTPTGCPCACCCGTCVATCTPGPTWTPEPTWTPGPTWTPAAPTPTGTPEPTWTPGPTWTPEPTWTPNIPIPTDCWDSCPTATPTITPPPTWTPEPTWTPVPTWTPQPTPTLCVDDCPNSPTPPPTWTPEPTWTPVPTWTPEVITWTVVITGAPGGPDTSSGTNLWDFLIVLFQGLFNLLMALFQPLIDLIYFLMWLITKIVELIGYLLWPLWWAFNFLITLIGNLSTGISTAAPVDPLELGEMETGYTFVQTILFSTPFAGLVYLINAILWWRFVVWAISKFSNLT